jgi:ABC-type lipoprotein release transport system permease subunit
VKTFQLVPLALKYLFRYRRRYFFLFIALSFGFGIITFITSIKDGMYENVYYSAQAHYAGDIICLGYDHAIPFSSYLDIESIKAIDDVIAETRINPSRIVKRTIFFEAGYLLYNGASVRQKYVFGVDWDNEKDFFDKLTYREAPQKPLTGDDIILISAPVAETLGARTGDRIFFEGLTRWGQKNTGVFVVGGVVEDSSIFGYYKSYISRNALNGLLLYSPEECSSVGLYFPGYRGIEKKRLVLQNALMEKRQTASLVYDRDEMAGELAKSWEGIKIILLTLPVYLSEISDLLGAINILAYFLFGMMLLIISLSAIVSYRLILHERIQELGTMRVIGFQESFLRRILIMEILGLGILSLGAGFILASFLGWAVRFFPLAWFPSMEIFMKAEKLSPLYLPKTTAANVIITICVLIFTVWIPVFRASRNRLPLMLNGGDM